MIKRITSANIIEDTCPLSHTTSLPSIHSYSHSHNNSHSDIHNQYHSHSHKCNSLLTCKVSDHGLEVKKRLQTTLSDFSLENSRNKWRAERRNKWWAERRVDINGEHDSLCERSFIVKDKILSTALCILENWFSGEDNTGVKDIIEVVGREEERREERRREGNTRVERA